MTRGLETLRLRAALDVPARAFATWLRSLLLILAGCDGSGARSIAVDDGGAKARVEALSEGQRNAVFLRHSRCRA